MPEVPYGDPGAMRAFAFDVSLAAGRIGDLGSDVYTGGFSFEWDGPAAFLFRTDLSKLADGTKAIADRLTALSSYLVQQAGILEQQQIEARREIAAIERMNKAKAKVMRP
jgi:hypothetical protein